MDPVSPCLRVFGSRCACNCPPALALLCAGAAQASDGDYCVVLENNHPLIVGSIDYYKTYAERGTGFLVTRLNNEQVFAAGFEPFH